MRLSVVVPAYNEQDRLAATLAALASQADRDFHLVIVDNQSNDATPAIARTFAAGAPMPVTVLVESQHGVGAAVDTGFRFALDNGATHLARTDADCIPHLDWIVQIKAGFAGGGDLLCGRIVARRDENGLLMRGVFRAMVLAAGAFGRVRPRNRGRDYLTPYRMHAGNNMAITGVTYRQCGGMPRRPSPTDREFLNRVRRVTPNIHSCPGMISENSLRRLHVYGVRATARWYLDRGPGPHTPDPR